jgi:creatinine amidohydrolase
MDSSALWALSMFLADLTWVEARDLLGGDCVVLLPIGAIEAHGPHLPLNTDVMIATETARRTAIHLRATGTLVVVAPALTFGVSYVGATFPGTLPVVPETVSSTIESVLGGFSAGGAKRFVVVNAHLEPAHVQAVRDGVARAVTATGARIAFPDKREEQWAAGLSEEFRNGARHAGSYETSLMLAAAPDAVRQDLLPGLLAVEIDLPARLRAGATTFAEAGGTEAYFGNPAAATREEGERLFDALVAMVVTALDELPDPTK